MCGQCAILQAFSMCGPQENPKKMRIVTKSHAQEWPNRKPEFWLNEKNISI